MSQVSCDRATEELMHARPHTPTPAANDDHFGIQDVSQSAEGMGNITGELTKLHTYALLISD